LLYHPLNVSVSAEYFADAEAFEEVNETLDMHYLFRDKFPVSLPLLILLDVKLAKLLQLRRVPRNHIPR
jgi:hypothetical protein